MAVAPMQPQSMSQLQRHPGPSGLAEVLDVILDKGLVIDVYLRVALVGIDVSGDAQELLGAGAILLAAVGYAVGPMMILNRHMSDVDPRAMMAAALSRPPRGRKRKKQADTGHQAAEHGDAAGLVGRVAHRRGGERV